MQQLFPICVLRHKLSCFCNFLSEETLSYIPRLGECCRCQTRGDNICIGDNASHLDYLAHTCPVFFPMCVIVHHWLVGGSVYTWSRKGPHGLYYPTIGPVQTTKKPSPAPQEEKQLDADTQCNSMGGGWGRFNVGGGVGSCPQTSFTDSSLIVWLLLFALNVLMFLVGVTAHLSLITWVLLWLIPLSYFSALITWVPTSLCGLVYILLLWQDLFLRICQKCFSGSSLHFDHQRNCCQRKCLKISSSFL